MANTTNEQKSSFNAGKKEDEQLKQAPEAADKKSGVMKDDADDIESEN